MKHTILKMKYLLIGLIFGLFVIYLTTYAALPSGGSIGSLFQKINNQYFLLGSNIKDHTVGKLQLKNIVTNAITTNTNSSKMYKKGIATNKANIGNLKTAQFTNTSGITVDKGAGNKIVNPKCVPQNWGCISAYVMSSKYYYSSLPTGLMYIGEVGNTVQISGTLAGPTISNINAAVKLNTAKKGITTAQIMAIDLNTAKKLTTTAATVTTCNAANLGKLNNNGYNCKRISVTNDIHCIKSARDDVSWFQPTSWGGHITVRCRKGSVENYYYTSARGGTAQSVYMVRHSKKATITKTVTVGYKTAYYF